MKNIISHVIMFILIISGFLSRDFLDNDNLPILVKLIMAAWAFFIIYIPVCIFWNDQRKLVLKDDTLSKSKYNKGEVVTFIKEEGENYGETIVGKIVHIDLIMGDIVYSIDEKEKSTLHLVPEAMVKPYNTQTNE